MVDLEISRRLTFDEGTQFKYVKHKTERIDKENFSYSYSVIEGDALKNTLEKIYYETKFVAAPGEGSICKSIIKYHTIGDIEVKQEQIKEGKEKAAGMYKAVGAYLLENPDLYN